MPHKILQSAYHDITEDNKLIVLATITTIFHSLILVIYILYQAYNVITKIEWWSTHLDVLKDYVTYIFWWNYIMYAFIIFAIILVFWYYFFPPIAESSLIYYLSSEKKSWSISLGKWFLKFFPMFELNWLFSFFNIFVFIIAITRFYVLWILNNFFVLTILGMRLLIIFLIAILLPYTKFILLLEEWKELFDAMRDSIVLSIQNMWTTFKFVILSYILYIRFIFNIMIIIWIPLLILYVIIKLGIGKQEFIKYIMYISIALVVAFSAYINWIIEAFFINYWYKVYKSIKNPEEEIKEESIEQSSEEDKSTETIQEKKTIKKINKNNLLI